MTTEQSLPTEAQIFAHARKVADSYAASYGDAPPRPWDRWDPNARDDFWDSAALNLGVPDGHPLRKMPDTYAAPVAPTGEILAPSEAAYTLHGRRHGVPETDTAEDLEEAVLLVRWSLDDNSWAVERIVDRDGVVVLEGRAMLDRAHALTREEAYD